MQIKHFVNIFYFLLIFGQVILGDKSEAISTSSSDEIRKTSNDKSANRDSNDKNVNTNNDFSAFQLLPTSANRSTFRCPEKFGYFADEKDCTKYFVCVFGEPLHESCTGGLYFSAELQTCDWPRNVQNSNCHNVDGSSTFISGSETDKKNPELNGGSFFSTVDESDDDSEDETDKKSSTQPSERQTTPSSVSSSLPEDFVGIPFKNVSNEQGTNRNYLDNQNDRSSDELLSRSVDGDVARTSKKQKASSENKGTTVTGDHSDYITESSLQNKPTDSSIYYENNDKSEVNNKHKQNANKINLDFEPMPPNYAEAVPSVVDSKGGIHYSDGVGGTFGIEDELPGVLSNSDNNKLITKT